jgi:hypothetical protein
MKLKHRATSLVTLLLSAVVVQSCCTSALWDSTDPDARLWMDADKITEAELQRRGIRYEMYEAEWGRGYLVEKSGWRRLHDYNLRLLGTPVTLTLDAVGSVAVVGVVILATNPELTGALIEAALDGNDRPRGGHRGGDAKPQPKAPPARPPPQRPPAK